MEITVFAKKRVKPDGKTSFYTYLSTLKKKSGELVTMQVKFRDECGKPKGERCPMNIVIEKDSCNISKQKYTKKDGTDGFSEVLWIGKWEEGSAYKDDSMSDYE